MKLAWLQNGLLTDYAISFYDFPAFGSIVNLPSPPQQLNGMVAFIFYAYLVGEYIMVLLRI
jgi:hypothetical protein